MLVQSQFPQKSRKNVAHLSASLVIDILKIRPLFNGALSKHPYRKIIVRIQKQ